MQISTGISLHIEGAALLKSRQPAAVETVEIVLTTYSTSRSIWELVNDCDIAVDYVPELLKLGHGSMSK